MSYNRRMLEQQIAEVAAGRRYSVDSGIREAVSSEEQYALERLQKQEQLRTEILRRQKDEAIAASNRAAAFQQQAIELEERELDEQERHHEEMERLGAEVRSAQKKLLKIARKEERANELHRERIEQLEEDRAKREEADLEARRLASSPCYASAQQLAQLKLLELPYIEHKILHEFLQKAKSIANEFQNEIFASDAEHLKIEAALYKERQNIALRLRARINNITAMRDKSKEEIAKLRRTLLGYFGFAKAKILPIEAELQMLNEKLASTQVAEIEAAGLARYPLSRMRRRRIVALTNSSPAIKSYQCLVADLMQWIHSEPRSSAFDRLISVNNCFRIDIDHSICVALDQARATGSQTVEYPGLGSLPFGHELAKLATRVKHMKNEANPLAEYPDGKKELDWLGIACAIGEFDLSRAPSSPKEMDSIPYLGVTLCDFEPEWNDALVQQAWQLVRSEQNVSVSLLQREFQLSDDGANELIERMEDEELISLPDKLGKRIILKQ